MEQQKRKSDHIKEPGKQHPDSLISLGTREELPSISKIRQLDDNLMLQADDVASLTELYQSTREHAFEKRDGNSTSRFWTSTSDWDRGSDKTDRANEATDDSVS